MKSVQIYIFVLYLPIIRTVACGFVPGDLFFESRLCPISIGKRKYRRFTPEGDTRKRGKEADRNAQEF